jgi:hypothetical protein
MATEHRVVDSDTTITSTDNKRYAKEIATTLIERRKPFSVFPDCNGWTITVGADDNYLPGAMGRWMDS